MDILIIKLGALGDVINTLPLAILLKKQLGARIHWLVAPLSRPLLDRHEAVDHTILFDRKEGLKGVMATIRQLRAQPFDLVLDLQRIAKSGLFAVAASGRRKLGFDRRRCKEMTWLLPMERIPGDTPRSHMLDQYLEFVHFLGLRPQPVQWQIPKTGALPDGLPDQYVVLNIGATKPANRWHTQGFATLAEHIARDYGLACVLTGGREDLPMAEETQKVADKTVHNLVGRTSLAQLVDVIDKASAVVTCDTGPMHLAVALERPVVALFGPSDYRRTGPYRGIVILAHASCAPCSRKQCEDPVCMSAIEPEMVMAGVREVLDGPLLKSPESGEPAVRVLGKHQG